MTTINHLFFESLPANGRRELFSLLQEKTALAGELLFNHGDAGDSLFLVQSGTLKVFIHNTRGEEVILNHFDPGDSFGEMALVAQTPRSASVSALTDARLLELRRTDFMRLIERYPLFTLGIIRDLSDKLRFANAYIQKATEWSRNIADGNYAAAKGEIEAVRSDIDPSQSDESRADAFLSAFFAMVSDVQLREEKMKQEMMRLQIEIDEVRKQEAVATIVETEEFEELRQKAETFRRKHQR